MAVTTRRSLRLSPFARFSSRQGVGFRMVSRAAPGFLTLLCLLSMVLLAKGCGMDEESANATNATDTSDAGDTGSGDGAIRSGDTRWTPGDHTLQADLAGKTFQLELALTEPKRRRGLMHREHLPADRGMLFVFPDEAVREFWMRNTRIDLDIIFLDRTGRIVNTDTMTAPADVAFNVEPDRARSGEPAQFVIELNRGAVHRLGLERGDRLDLPWARLKAHAR